MAKEYLVRVTAKFPAVGERPGEFLVRATTSAEAVRMARRLMSDAGHTRQDGPVFYRAFETRGCL